MKPNYIGHMVACNDDYRWHVGIVTSELPDVFGHSMGYHIEWYVNPNAENNFLMSGPPAIVSQYTLQALLKDYQKRVRIPIMKGRFRNGKYS